MENEIQQIVLEEWVAGQQAVAFAEEGSLGHRKQFLTRGRRKIVEGLVRRGLFTGDQAIARSRQQPMVIDVLPAILDLILAEGEMVAAGRPFKHCP